MFGSATGLVVVLITYVIVPLLLAGILYLVVRLAVLHALKAHTRWVDAGKE